MALMDIIRSMNNINHNSFTITAYNDSSTVLPVNDSDKIFMQHNGTILEYDCESKTFINTDFILTKPDYVSIVTSKISEICSNLSYESSENHPFKTEATAFKYVADANVIDLLKGNIDISSLNIKEIVKFLINVKADIIKSLKESFEVDEDDDVYTVCMIGLRGILKEETAEAEQMKKILLITDLVMKQLECMRLAAKSSESKKNKKESEENKEENKDSK